jgi:DNA polymerase-3 subunit beta
VKALSRALSSRIVLLDLTIGLKGLLGYLKALGGSNIVKIVPSNGSASGSQTNGHRVLKVVCGSNTSYLEDMTWVGEKTPMTLCQVRVSPVNTVKPNLGAGELADALNRVLPFTASDDNRPVLQCVNFVAKEGKLTLASADGFRLAVVNLDYDDGEGNALINRDDLKGIANALRRAKRVRVSFEGEDIKTLTIETELIRYKWVSVNGSYPDYEKLIPTEFNGSVSFDTVEAIKAIASLKVLADSKEYPIDLTIGDGKMVMANPDDKGQAELPADTDGNTKIRVDGGYLASVLRACGGMIELKLTNAYSPMLFSQDGYQVVVMPMLTSEANQQAKEDKGAKAETATAETAETAKPKRKGKGKGKGKGKVDTEPEPEPEPQTEPEAEPVAEPVAEPEPEAEPVAVA